MTPVEENATAHDQTTKPNVEWKMPGNHATIVQQQIESLMRSKYGGHPGNNNSLHKHCQSINKELNRQQQSFRKSFS